MDNHDATCALTVDTLAIVGVGLIGGSFALALKQAGVCRQVFGVGRRVQVLDEALRLGIIDRAVSLKEAAAQADLIMIAAPVGAFADIFSAMKPHLSSHAIITDGGSTKGNVVAAARACLGEKVGQFVPAHPIAGSHESGPAAAVADLYRDKHLIVCPLPENSSKAVQGVRAAWQACGAKVLTLGIEQHDEVVAAISHLPHWLASLYMAHIAQSANAAVELEIAGAGFRDFTRIAQGSEEMWRDIFLANRRAMLSQIDQLQGWLDQARKALDSEDGAWIESMLTRGAEVRRDWGQGRYQVEPGDE